MVSKDTEKALNEPARLNQPFPYTAESDSHIDESDLDDAWKFLRSAGAADENAVEAVNLSSLRRKIDWRILPLLFCCYVTQLLDKVVLNYAAVMGLPKELNFDPKRNQFSDLATFLAVGTLLFEIPNIYFLQKFPAAKWLAANVVCWGIATACGAAAHNFQAILVARVFLGIFEATVGPSLAIISSQWYTKSEQAPRYSFWYLGVGMGQIIGGAISYGFQHVAPDADPSGWRIMFITLGAFTVLVGICVCIFIPDTPMQASWLSTVEKAALLKHVAANQTGISNHKFRPGELLEAFLDPQMYCFFIANLGTSISSGVVTTYSATLIKGLLYDSKQAALMNMPSGAVGCFFTLLVGFGIRKGSNRWAWVLLCAGAALIGSGLMSFLPSTSKAGVLAGIYLVNATIPALFVFYSWALSNVAGATKRAFAAAIVSASFSLGNIIGPQTFRAQDAASGYRFAKIFAMGGQAMCIVFTLILVSYYWFMNRRRTDRSQETEKAYKSAEVWHTVTDAKNKHFIYSY